jgi:hypothetical protein
MKQALLTLSCLAGLFGCNDSVVSPPSGQGGSSIHIPSASEIKARKEPYHAQQIAVLQAKDPQADARAAIARGDRHFLCNAGRSATVPGLTPEAYAQVRDKCPTECLDGVTDAIYGENHRHYLAVALDYSARWNAVMFNACR